MSYRHEYAAQAGSQQSLPFVVHCICEEARGLSSSVAPVLKRPIVHYALFAVSSCCRLASFTSADSHDLLRSATPVPDCCALAISLPAGRSTSRSTVLFLAVSPATVTQGSANNL